MQLNIANPVSSLKHSKIPVYFIPVIYSKSLPVGYSVLGGVQNFIENCSIGNKHNGERHSATIRLESCAVSLQLTSNKDTWHSGGQLWYFMEPILSCTHPRILTFLIEFSIFSNFNNGIWKL